jgi:glutamyl-Q tRNA(Asp) synthetase
MEDVDGPRCIQGADKVILKQLQQCGLHWDGDVIYQSQRGTHYQQALENLLAKDLVYPCGCTRKEIEENQALLGLDLSRNKAAVYPGTCREGLQGKQARAWRFNVHKWSELRGSPVVEWTDRRLGPQSQNVLEEVGDFVLKRADGLWAYQLAVVVDDAKQGITHVVRGEDLSDNTARQMLLQEALGYSSPKYLHTALIWGVNGEKLSKQNGAKALNLSSEETICQSLISAASTLGLDAEPGTLCSLEQLPSALVNWTQAWAYR